MAKISLMMSGARPSEGSSSRSIRGLPIMARPMASICCSPPESEPASWPLRSLSLGSRSYTVCRLSSISVFGRRYAPIIRLSLTEKRGNTCRPSGERMMPDWTIFLVSRLVISLPSNQILPLLTGMRPIMAFMVVLFPAPFAPMRVMTSPALTSMSIPLSA